jgi:DNA-binding transcriptional ArsR family regulator
MAETLFSLATLRGREEETTFGGWRRRVRACLDSRFAVLAAIAPPRLPHFDMAILAGPARDFDEGAAKFLAAPAIAVRMEVDFYASHHGRPPDPLTGLVDTPAVRREVLSTVEKYHSIAVAPHWRHVRAHLDAERAQRGTILLDHGVDGFLCQLHPDIQWTPPTLRVNTGYLYERDFHLDGRGLLVAPSFFLRRPAIMYNPRDPGACILLYPAMVGTDHAAGIWSPGTPTHALGKLLGRTRASMLAAIADGVTTTGALARRLEVSSPAVSQHTSILREAGLITTRRHRSGTLHHLTQTGLSLLDHGRNP